MSSLLSKVPWASHEPSDHARSQGQESTEVSLTTILPTAEDRGALTILVVECTQAMRKSLEDVFDPRETGEPNQVSEDPTAVAGQRATNPAETEEQERAQHDFEKREKELATARFVDLKKAALHYFDAWSNSAIARIGEAVNKRDEHGNQVQPPKADTNPDTQQSASQMRFLEPSEYDKRVDELMIELYPPTKTPLMSLSEAKRMLILHSILLLLLGLEHYHAHSRVLMLHMTTSLGLSISSLGHDESKIARGLLAAAEKMEADEDIKKKAEENRTARKWKVGLAAAAGAAIIGVTGGLAAPFLAAGVGTVMGGLGLGGTVAAGYLGTLAGSSVLVGGLFGAYGGRMTSEMMDKYAREVEDFGFEPVRSHHKPRKIEKEYRRLRVGISVSGWLTKPDDVVEPWKPIGIELENFALRWELEALINLGNSLSTIVKSAVWTVAKREIIQRTVFAALTAGLWPLGLLKAARIVDNPWSIASYRAQKAGEVLADALLNKAQGERPVTLVGYSLGAKVIYTCLQQLAERRAFGLVESVVLIGAPTPSTSADWRMIRSVVCGRVVNVYSKEDYILAFLYRTSSIQLGVAGLEAITNVKGIENVDVSDMVKEGGHTSYRFLTGSILKRIGFENVDYQELAKANEELRHEEEKAHRERQADVEQNGTDVSDEKVQSLEAQVEEKNKQSYIQWAQSKLSIAGANASGAFDRVKAQLMSHRSDPESKVGAETPVESTGYSVEVTSITSRPMLPPRPNNNNG